MTPKNNLKNTQVYFKAVSKNRDTKYFNNKNLQKKKLESRKTKFKIFIRIKNYLTIFINK